MVHTGPAWRCPGREHGLVCGILVLCCCLPGSAFRPELGAISGAVHLAARRQLDRAPAARRARSQGAQQDHAVPTWHVAVRPARSAPCAGGQRGNGGAAGLPARDGPGRVLTELLLASRDRRARSPRDDPRRLWSPCAVAGRRAQHDRRAAGRRIPEQRPHRRRRRDPRDNGGGGLRRSRNRPLRRSSGARVAVSPDVTLREPDQAVVAEDAGARHREVPESAGPAAKCPRVHEGRRRGLCERRLSFALDRGLSRLAGADRAGSQRHMESGRESPGPRAPQRDGGARVLAGLPCGAGEHRERARGSQPGRGRARGSPGVVPGTLRSERCGRLAPASGSRGLSQRPGVHPGIHSTCR